MTAFLQQLKDKLNFIGFEGDYNRFFANTADEQICYPNIAGRLPDYRD